MKNFEGLPRARSALPRMEPNEVRPAKSAPQRLNAEAASGTGTATTAVRQEKYNSHVGKSC